MQSLRSLTLLCIFLPVLLLSSSALASAPQLEILYWPIANPEPSVLAHVSYDPAKLKSDLIDYFPPAELSQDLARVGFYVTTPTNPKQWVGTLASSSALAGDDAQKPTLRLHVSSSNEIYHISLGSAAASASSSTAVQVELVVDEFGPRPHLNRPVVVGPDGKNPEEQPEKTIFQK